MSVLLSFALLTSGATTGPAVSAVPVAQETAADMLALVPMPELSETVQYQLVIEQRVIIRVPARRTSLTSFSASTQNKARPPEPIVEWKEVDGPKCLPMRRIMGVIAAERGSVDLITREQQRFRAELNRGCRALDFYSGFYMQPSKDGQVCRDRDELHARSGAKCQVDEFHLMVPKRRKD